MKYFFLFLLLFQIPVQADQAPFTTETLYRLLGSTPVVKSNYTRREINAENKVYKKMTGIYLFKKPYFLFETRDVKRAYFIGSRDPNELAILTFRGGRATYYTEEQVQLLKALGYDLLEGDSITPASISPISFYIFKYPRLFTPEITYRLLMSGNARILHEIFYEQGLTGTYSKWTVELIPVFQDLGHVVSYVSVYGKKNRIKTIVVHDIGGGGEVVHFS